MKIVCKNSECTEQGRFFATAHIVEEWLIDREGNWVRTLGSGEVVKGPFVEDAQCPCGSSVEVMYD